ncbi:MAG TPA: hypothetical protein VGB60_03045 [Brevundimonas sp.]|jgi:hypothetical protein|uniref:hypothetical protein n=1 Tax=Brevundimonas sp. TaxID=1871086 RepID=UPI002ED89EF9
MKTISRCAMALTLAAAVAGCSSDMVTGGPLIRPGEPQGTIRVENATSGQLHAVLISTCSASTYGLNRLPSGMAIPPGGFYNFTVSAGCWDVSGGTLGVGDARGRIQVGPGGTSSIRIF